MKKLLFLIAIICLATSFSFGQKSKNRAKSKNTLRIKIMNGDKLPEGVYEKDNKLYAKKGFKFVKDKEQNILLMRISRGNVMGKFWCLCSAEESTGGCRTLTYGTHLECNPNDEKPPCQRCELRVLIGDDFSSGVKKPNN